MSTTVLVAAALAALAGWCAVPGPRRSPVEEVRRPRTWGPWAVLTLVLAALGLPGRWAVAATVAAAVALVLAALVRRRRRRVAHVRTAAQVLEACDLLAAELAAGRPVIRALVRAAEVCDPLQHAAEAAQLASDVPGAMRAAATTPGAGDLRVLAAAWEVAHRSGQGLATAVDRVAERLRAERRTARVVAAELASARSTARLVAALPLVAWAMGAGTGARPVAFLLGSPVGIGCLVLGAGLLLAGLWWIELLAESVQRR